MKQFSLTRAVLVASALALAAAAPAAFAETPVETLQAWQGHRDEIIRTIARLEREELDRPGGPPLPPP